MSENPIVIFHGWSDQASSFDRLAGILRDRLKREVEEIFLVDWLSLDDEVSYADLSSALQTAWTQKNLPTRAHSVDMVIHSTGALVGNEGYRGVKAAANEDGSDRTVRISTANLNVNKMEIDLVSDRKEKNKRVTLRPVNPYHHIAFGILDGETHGSIIANEKDPQNPQTLDLIERALSVTEAGWGAWCEELAALRQNLADKYSNRSDTTKHEYVNLVTRVRDDVGNPVNDYFIEFFEGDKPDKSTFGAFFHREALRSVHCHKNNHANRCLYLDFSLLKKRMAKPGFTKLTIRIHAEPQIDERDPKEDEWSYEKKLKERRVGYSGHRELTLTREEVLTEIIPNQTLLIEVVLKREIAHIVLVRN